jgi:hypothetical protein
VSGALTPEGPGWHIDEFKGCGEIQLRLSRFGQHETRKKMFNPEEHLEAWYNGPESSPEPDTSAYKQFDWLQAGTHEHLSKIDLRGIDPTLRKHK